MQRNVLIAICVAGSVVGTCLLIGLALAASAIRRRLQSHQDTPNSTEATDLEPGIVPRVSAIDTTQIPNDTLSAFTLGSASSGSLRPSFDHEAPSIHQDPEALDGPLPEDIQRPGQEELGPDRLSADIGETRIVFDDSERSYSPSLIMPRHHGTSVHKRPVVEMQQEADLKVPIIAPPESLVPTIQESEPQTSPEANVGLAKLTTGILGSQQTASDASLPVSPGGRVSRRGIKLWLKDVADAQKRDAVKKARNPERMPMSP